jgi:metal-responsive CopG/Arc/MetJ family transcriptional regulator
VAIMIENSMKLNLTLNKDLVKQYEDMASNMCIPRSALMTIALIQYMEQKQALNSMSSFEDLVGRMEGLNGKEVEK